MTPSGRPAPRLDAAGVARAATVFGLGEPLAPARLAARGQQGIVWRLRTGRGAFAVKELLVPVAEDDLAAELALLPEMLRRGVPAPGPVRSLDGPVLARIGGALVRVATWVDVEDARTDLDPRALGALLAVLHRDPLPAHGPVDPWYTDGVPPHTWEEVAQALAGARAPFAAEFAASVPGFLDLQEAFRPPETVQLCHRDLWANNLRATPDGGLCVLDWDNCGPAGATQELAVVLVEFCAGDAERVGALCRAYLAAGGRGLPAEPGDLTMVLAQFGHFALTAGRRWLAAGDDDARARAEAWFREGYEHPLDRRGVEELLSAVRAAVRAAGRPA